MTGCLDLWHLFIQKLWKQFWRREILTMFVVREFLWNLTRRGQNLLTGESIYSHCSTACLLDFKFYLLWCFVCNSIWMQEEPIPIRAAPCSLFTAICWLQCWNHFLRSGKIHPETQHRPFVLILCHACISFSGRNWKRVEAITAKILYKNILIIMIPISVI